MARSVSLSAYLALARRAPPTDWVPVSTPVPDHALVWLHAGTVDSAAALCQIAHRFEGRDGLAHFLLTGPEGFAPPDPLPPGVTFVPTPPENIQAVEQFVGFYKPRLLIWGTGNLRPALLTTVARRNVSLWLVDADHDALEDARWRWLPDMSRGVIEVFDHAFARNANGARRLRRMGMNADRVEITGPLQRTAPALPFHEAEREDLAAAIGGRPVWMAAAVQPDEVDAILAAHRTASRSTHRLLLILVPRLEADYPAIAAAVKEAELRAAFWELGELPSEATQILVVDAPDDMGLWYRMAPMVLLCSSFRKTGQGCDPWPAATLGAAILTGPYQGGFAGDFARLADAGGARIVREPGQLANAVARLTAADQAAAMANAAWEIATEGAEATDALLDRLDAMLAPTGAA